MAIKHIILLFVETPRQLTWCFHAQTIVLDIFIVVKQKKSWGHRTRFEDMTSAICHLFPNIYMAPS
jgi:hypothetical protein